MHDFLPGQCYICGRETPFGIYETVYKTKNGSVLHNLRDCAFLYSGQNFADSGGKANHPINPTPWHSVFNSIGACEWCCAAHNVGRENLKQCEVYLDKEWTPALWIRDRYISNGIYEHLIYFESSKKISIFQSEGVRLIK
jgi:hypothetical protein